MHELSLVASILEMVEQDAHQRGIKRITFIRVVAGEFAAVNSRALTFALENVVKGTILEEAEVDFSVREAWETCPGCQEGFKPRLPFFQCPKCNKPVSPAPETRQVYIDYYEGE